MNNDTLICLWILVYPIGIIEVSTSCKCCFCHYCSSLHDYWTPSTWNSLVNTSRGQMERCEKRAFQLVKMRKENQLKHKNRVRNRLYIDGYVFEYEGLYLSLRGEHITHKRLINFNKNNKNSKIFCLQVTGYLRTRKSFPICMFVVMISGKCYLHIHFTFLQEF